MKTKLKTLATKTNMDETSVSFWLLLTSLIVAAVIYGLIIQSFMVTFFAVVTFLGVAVVLGGTWMVENSNKF